VASGTRCTLVSDRFLRVSIGNGALDTGHVPSRLEFSPSTMLPHQSADTFADCPAAGVG